LIEKALEAQLAAVSGTGAIHERLEALEQRLGRLQRALEVYGEAFLFWATTELAGLLGRERLASTGAGAARNPDAFLRRLVRHLAGPQSFLVALLRGTGTSTRSEDHLAE
jgi:hypothetical protein